MSENSQSLRKRSSLKTNNSLFPQEVDKKKSKRMSVNWNVDLKNLNYQEMKISFNVNNESVKKTSTFGKEKFIETRKKSIKNEFTKVKEMLKDYDLYEDLEADRDITLQNTKMNYEVGKLSTDSNEKSVENDNFMLKTMLINFSITNFVKI